MGRLYTSMRAVQFLCSYSDSGNQLHFSKAEFVGNVNTYLRYFSIRPILSNTAITTTTTTSWDSRGTLVLKVPSIHRSIKQYSGYQNDTTPLSSDPSEVAGPGQTTSSLTRANEQTEEGSKQAKQHVQHQKPLPTNQPTNKNSSPIF